MHLISLLEVMMANKIRVNLTVDPNLWQLAKDKLPCSRSEFFENQLKLFLGIEDNESEILKDIKLRENEINALKDKLCHIRKEKQLELESNRSMEKAMVSLNRIHERLGMIGVNQIRNMSHVHKVEFEDLKKECENNCMNIVEFAEVPKHDSVM